MPKLKVGHISPIPKEDSAINAGIAADPDSRELDAEWFAQARPASEVLPPEMYAALLASFKSTGKGWQTRVNAALRQYLDEHPIGH